MIERVRQEDIHKIEQLENSFPHLFVDFPVNRRLSTNIFTQIFTMTDNSEIVGCLIIDFIYDRMELIQIEVQENKRNLGYGNKLMEFMINKAIENKVVNITLEVKETNEAAISLYKKYKFEIVAIREKYYQGIDGYLMERKMM